MPRAKKSLKEMLPPLAQRCKHVSDFDLWLRAYLGYTVPHVAVCKKHVSPLEALWLVASEQVGDTLIVANRSGTKTMGLAAVATYNLVTKPNYEIVVMAAGINQAGELLQHIRNFLSRLAALSPEQFDGMRASAERIYLPNGSRLQVRAATLRGANAPHPHMCIFDELECLEDWTIIEEALSMAMDDSVNGYRGMNVFSSSRKFRFGSVQKMLEEAEERGIAVFVWCAFETAQRCTAPSCEKCAEIVSGGVSFKDVCGGRARYSSGYIPLEHIISEFRRLSRHTFEAQWLCLRPPPIGLVFPNFDMSVHVARQPLDYDARYPTVGGLDFGFEDPTVLLLCQQAEGKFIVFKEVVWRRTPITAVIPQIREWCKSYNVVALWCDPSRPDIITSLQAEGLPAFPAPKVEKLQRIEMLRALLDKNEIVISPTCELLVDQLEGYHYEIDRARGEPTDKLSDGNDDTIDALGYILAGLSAGVIASANVAQPPQPQQATQAQQTPPITFATVTPLPSPEDTVTQTLRDFVEAMRRGGLLPPPGVQRFPL